METGFFPLLAHPDVIFTNDFPWDKNCADACDLIVDAAARAGTVLELNANGIRKGIRLLGGVKRFPYPHPEFWKRVSAAKLPVVIGSDCHQPSYMWDGCVQEALRLAREWKLELVDLSLIHISCAAFLFQSAQDRSCQITAWILDLRPRGARL